MSTIQALPQAGLPRAIAATVLSCALALAGTAQAQSTDEPPPDAAAVAQVPSTRGIFVATIVTLIAHGLGNSLANVLGGSITRWFAPGPKRAEAGAKPARASATKGKSGAAAGLHAGLAYEVHLIGTDGSDRAVDPARHEFHTGDRFQIYYRPALPGRVRVFNIDPKGMESGIDGAELAAGQLAALGPYQFVGTKGQEMIRIVLEPCSSARLSAATRGIVKVGGSGGANPAVRIAECSDPGARALNARPRTIGKATIDGATAFALDPLSREELSTGRVAAREVRIALRHR